MSHTKLSADRVIRQILIYRCLSCEIPPLMREDAHQDFVIVAFFDIGSDSVARVDFSALIIILPFSAGVSREHECVLLEPLSFLSGIGSAGEHDDTPIILSVEIGCKFASIVGPGAA